MLREAGRQLLVYSGEDTSPELDLTGESGVYHVHVVAHSGKVAAASGDVVAGKKVVLPAGVVWLTRD